MPSTKRINIGLAVLITVLAVLFGAVVAYVTVESNTHSRFVPGSGLTVPAGEVESGVVGGDR